MNEWIEKARGGDASAMDYLIDQYRKIGNEKEAAYWQAYRDAADSAIASMNRLSEIAETAEAAMALGLFDAAEEGFEKALPICRELLKIENGADCHFPDSERENVQKTYRTLSRDYAAVVYFQYEDHARVIQMLEEADCTDGESLTLIGASCYRLRCMSDAFRALNAAYAEREYLSPDSADWRQTAFAEGMRFLSLLYRDGAATNGKKHPEKAIEVLKNALRALTDEDAIHTILSELNRYCKERSGSYQYA